MNIKKYFCMFFLFVFFGKCYGHGVSQDHKHGGFNINEDVACLYKGSFKVVNDKTNQQVASNYGVFDEKVEVVFSIIEKKIDNCDFSEKYGDLKLSLLRDLFEFENTGLSRYSARLNKHKELTDKRRVIINKHKEKYYDDKRLYEKGLISKEEFDAFSKEISDKILALGSIPPATEYESWPYEQDFYIKEKSFYCIVFYFSEINKDKVSLPLKYQRRILSQDDCQDIHSFIK